nr:hypothetical protein [Tanacetum cinerariifolium]
MALWKSQMEEHASDWLRVVLISELGQTMNGSFAGDIYGDHAVSCAGIIGIKHRHNVVRDTLVDICFRGMDVCVDLIGSSPLTQTGMVDFVSGRVVIEAAQRKRAKYETKCADIGYGFLPFSFSSFRELEKDALKEKFRELCKDVSNFVKEREDVVQELERLSGNHVTKENVRLLRRRQKRDLYKMTRLQMIVNESHLSVGENHTFVSKMNLGTLS